MARVTVEDCLEHMENRFALVHAAALRSNELLKGATPLHICKNKEIVTALREIADGDIELLEEGNGAQPVAKKEAKPAREVKEVKEEKVAKATKSAKEKAPAKKETSKSKKTSKKK